MNQLPSSGPNISARQGPGIGVISSYTGSMQEARDYLRRPSKCPRTSTMMGYHKATGRHRFIPIRCKCWTCEHCAKINKYLLEQKIASGEPDRMVTLTCRPVEGYTPKEIHDRCRKKIPLLFAALRKEFGEIEYAAVLETTAKGMPHWHILCRGGYIPQARLKQLWHKMTGNFVVGVEKIRSAKSVQSYIVKYLAKDFEKHKSERLGRLISFSKRYLSPTRVTLRDEEWVWERSPYTISWIIDYQFSDRFWVQISNEGIVDLLPKDPPLSTEPDAVMLRELGGEEWSDSDPVF